MRKKLIYVLVLLSSAILLFGCSDDDDKKSKADRKDEKEQHSIIVMDEESSRESEDLEVSGEEQDHENGEIKESDNLGSKDEEQKKQPVMEIEKVEVAKMDDKDDPMKENTSDGQGSGASVSVDTTTIEFPKNENETNTMALGIDVAKWQGNIDWNAVKISGIQFALIRVGYRAESTGLIYEDPCARYNLQQAQAAGIKLGAYFYSTAITDTEAREEAEWVTSFISQYPITYPVAFNCENYKSATSRQNSLTKEQRSSIAQTFLDVVASKGYEPMFYASKSELSGNSEWLTDKLSAKYKIWVAEYPSVPFPATSAPTYSGKYNMWQYTSKGTIAGIPKACDVNVAYFSYNNDAVAKDTSTPVEIVEADPEVGIVFTEVEETVTAKSETNLRSVPNQESDDTIVARLKNGETATRTGIGNNGWARVIYNGQKLYAVSSYLTTDLGYQASVQSASQSSNDEFVAVNDEVTPKIQSNLRSEPHTDNDDTIIAVIDHGEVLTRTGISEKGWSRIDYNGQTVYAVTSYLQSPE